MCQNLGKWERISNVKFTVQWERDSVKVLKSISHVGLFATPWISAHQASLSTEFSRQEYWSGLPFPSPDPANPGMQPRSPVLQADSSPSESPGKPTVRWWTLIFLNYKSFTYGMLKTKFWRPETKFKRFFLKKYWLYPRCTDLDNYKTANRHKYLNFSISIS